VDIPVVKCCYTMIAVIALLFTPVASNTSYTFLVAATARPFERLEELGNRSTAPGAFRFPGEHHYHQDDEFPANIRTLCATGRPFVFAVGDAHEASLARPLCATADVRVVAAPAPAGESTSHTHTRRRRRFKLTAIAETARRFDRVAYLDGDAVLRPGHDGALADAFGLMAAANASLGLVKDPTCHNHAHLAAAARHKSKAAKKKDREAYDRRFNEAAARYPRGDPRYSRHSRDVPTSRHAHAKSPRTQRRALDDAIGAATAAAGAVGQRVADLEAAFEAADAVVRAGRLRAAAAAEKLRAAPDDFCDRNGGVVLVAGAGGAARAREWLDEFEAHPDPRGYDEPSLRAVLWRRRGELYDLPNIYNCREGNVPEAERDACVVAHGIHWDRATPPSSTSTPPPNRPPRERTRPAIAPRAS